MSVLAKKTTNKLLQNAEKGRWRDVLAHNMKCWIDTQHFLLIPTTSGRRAPAIKLYDIGPVAQHPTPQSTMSSSTVAVLHRPKGPTRTTQTNPATRSATCNNGHAASAAEAAPRVSATKKRRAEVGPPLHHAMTPAGKIVSSMPSTSVLSDTKRKQNAPTPVAGSSSRNTDRQPAAADEAVPPVPKSKRRKPRGCPISTTPTSESASTAPTTSGPTLEPQSNIRRPATPPLSITISTPSTSTTFDPKSIVPHKESTKSFSILSSSSGSTAILHPGSFQCIDGVLRTIDPKESVTEPESDNLLSMYDQHVASDAATAIDHNREPREQFQAFGIAAFPTRAQMQDICYDFVSYTRWCPHGHRCNRVHPLDKNAYLPKVIHEKVLRARNVKNVASTYESPVEIPRSPSPSPSHVKSTSMQDTARVRLPTTHSRFAVAEPSTPIPRHRSTTSVPVASSSKDVQDWDTMVGLHPRVRSPSSSGSSNSEDERRLWTLPNVNNWDVCTDASGWSDDNDTETRVERLQQLERRILEGTVVMAGIATDKFLKLIRGELASQPVENASPKVQLHPRPRNSERCKKWLRDQCTLGYDCKYIHDDLDYDDDDPPDMPAQKPLVRGPEYHTAVLHGHMHLKMGPGFAIENITTGFESRVIFLANLPPLITDSTLKRILDNFGEVTEIRRPPSHVQSQSSLSVRVEYSKSVEAYKAFTTLHGTNHFGRKLEVRMAIEAKHNGSIIKDTAVYIDWDYAYRTVYMGYASQALAEAAATKARHVLYDGEYQTSAEVYIGIPAVGKVTVKFDYLPPKVTQEGMKVFGDHQGMVTARNTYEDYTLQDNINGIKRLCKQFQSTMTDLEFRPSPYRGGKMRAFAYFSTPKAAEEATRNLSGRAPVYTGRTKIIARHIKTISFSLGYQKYQKVSRDVHYLSRNIWQHRLGYSLTVVEKPSYVTLRLSGEDLRVLGQLKSQVERTLNGEPILIDGKVAWDDFLRTPSGASYLRDLEASWDGVIVENDTLRRTIRVFGHYEKRLWVRQSIIYKIQEMNKKKWHTINLDSTWATALSTGPLDELKKRFGSDNFFLNHWHNVLRVRGDEEMVTTVSDEVNALRKRVIYISPEKKALIHECPVCLNEASLPVPLGCGHTFCLACLKRYLLASVDHKFFPLKCLGNLGKCEERVSLALAKMHLPPDEFNAIVEAAFSAHIHTHPDEFRFCPTPDCPQIYRSAKEGVFIQCPSCLVRICPNCHSDAHDGLSCAEAGSGDDLFQDWAGKHSVKQCPRCKMGIEKDEGCNHMVCLICKTHICWVCSKTFPNGDGIYAHMNAVHGGIGLVQDG